MKHNKGIKILTIIIIIIFLIATFGVVVLYLASPDENQSSETLNQTQVPITEPEIFVEDPEIDIIDPSTTQAPEPEIMDIDLAPQPGEPVPALDPAGNDPTEDLHI